MGKKKRRSVEYKDTFDFRLFPEYTYTNAQRKRLRLFQGRIEHWRAAINYADCFDCLNEINLVYMIGYKPQIKAYVEKTKSNIVVLCADVPQEFLDTYNAYWSLVKQYQASGYANKDGMLPIYFADREKEEAYRDKGVLSEDLYRRNDKEAAIISGYQRITEEAAGYFSQYRVISKLLPEQSISHDKLDWIIKKYFPFGREQSGMGEKAYISIQKTNKALEAGLEQKTTANLLDLPAGMDCYTVCKKSIRRCQMNICTAIRETGYVDLADLVDNMKRPPYGWGDDPYAVYSIGYALSDYLDNTWIWDGVCCFPTREVAASVVRNIFRKLPGKRSPYVMVSEAGQRLSSRFAYMFGIEEGELCPRDDTDRRILEFFNSGMSERRISDELGTISNIAVHKRITKMRSASMDNTPFCNMSLRICSRIEKTTRWPVSLVDEHLRDTLCGEYSFEKHASIPVFGKDKVRTEISYYTQEKCKALKKVLAEINTIVPAMICERYGAVEDMEDLKKLCTTSSSGWLWDSKMFWECVERYMAGKN